MSEYLKRRLTKMYHSSVINYGKEKHRVIGVADLMETNTIHQVKLIACYYLPKVVTAIKTTAVVITLLLLAATAMYMTIKAIPNIVTWTIEMVKMVIATIGTIVGLLM